MKRVVLLACAVIMVMSPTGCSKWKKKHLYRSAYVEGDSCGCGASHSGPIVDDGPAFESFGPTPQSSIISAPSKSPLPTGQF